MALTGRDGIRSARRVVVKVGSSSISGQNAGQITHLVDALYTKPPSEPGAELISTVAAGDALSQVTFGDIGAAGVGTGGASTKVSAARLAAEAGAGVLITSTGLVASALNGDDIGTWFEPTPRG